MSQYNSYNEYEDVDFYTSGDTTAWVVLVIFVVLAIVASLIVMHFCFQ